MRRVAWKSVPPVCAKLPRNRHLQQCPLDLRRLAAASKHTSAVCFAATLSTLPRQSRHTTPRVRFDAAEAGMRGCCADSQGVPGIQQHGKLASQCSATFQLGMGCWLTSCLRARRRAVRIGVTSAVSSAATLGRVPRQSWPTTPAGRLGAAEADVRGCSDLAKRIGLTQSPWFSAARRYRLEIAISRFGHGLMLCLKMWTLRPAIRT